jgi:hypothetical protein
VVESTALEMRHTGNRIGGSNPPLSARRRFSLHPLTSLEIPNLPVISVSLRLSGLSGNVAVSRAIAACLGDRLGDKKWAVRGCSTG